MMLNNDLCELNYIYFISKSGNKYGLHNILTQYSTSQTSAQHYLTSQKQYFVFIFANLNKQRNKPETLFLQHKISGYQIVGELWTVNEGKELHQD